MEKLAMNEFRRQVGEYVNQTYYAGKAFVLTKGEKRVAALLPVAMLDRLKELEAFYARTIAESQQAVITSTEGETTSK